MKKTVKRVLLAIVAAAVVAGGIYYKTMPLVVETTVVNPKTAELTFTEQGLVLALRQVEVYSTVSGEITRLDVVEGQHVNQGDLICVVDDRQDQADLDRAKEKEGKLEVLYKEGYIPEQDLLDAQNAVDDIERVLKEKKIIRAPVSGQLILLNIKDTNVVNAQTPVAVITAGKDCVVESYVYVKDMGAIDLGKKVVLVLQTPNAAKEIPGTIIDFDNFATDQISVLGVEERKVKVTIAPDDSGELKDGYDPDVRFSYYREPNKLAVPKTAVFKDNDSDMVFVVRNGKAQKVRVRKGMELRTEFVIDAGLSQGDTVITDSNVKGLKDGVRCQAPF